MGRIPFILAFLLLALAMPLLFGQEKVDASESDLDSAMQELRQGTPEQKIQAIRLIAMRGKRAMKAKPILQKLTVKGSTTLQVVSACALFRITGLPLEHTLVEILPVENQDVVPAGVKYRVFVNLEEVGGGITGLMAKLTLLKYTNPKALRCIYLYNQCPLGEDTARKLLIFFKSQEMPLPKDLVLPPWPTHRLVAAQDVRSQDDLQGIAPLGALIIKNMMRGPLRVVILLDGSVRNSNELMGAAEHIRRAVDELSEELSLVEAQDLTWGLVGAASSPKVLQELTRDFQNVSVAMSQWRSRSASPRILLSTIQYCLDHFSEQRGNVLVVSLTEKRGVEMDKVNDTTHLFRGKKNLRFRILRIKENGKLEHWWRNAQ